MANWLAALRADPLEWLLEPGDPAVRHLALQQLLDRPIDEPDVAMSSRAAMATDPIASILAAQETEGHWEKPGPGYATKYRGTVWQLIFLDQLGADPEDARVRRACEYVLSHSQADNGGFGASGVAGGGPPPPSYVIHCLTGNLLRALIGFGWLDDQRVVRAIEWQARAITGDGVTRWYASSCGPGFACGANERLPNELGLPARTRAPRRCGGGAAARLRDREKAPGGAAQAAGSSTSKRAPAPGSFVAVTRPPCRSATARTIARPRPDVPVARSRARSAW